MKKYNKMKLLDGNKVASKIVEDLKQDVENLKKKGVEVCLGIILVGDRKDSETYVRMKKRRCKEIGIKNYDILLSEDVTEEQVLEKVNRMNKDPNIHGILVQLPLPKHINPEKVISSISVEKDVDGFHPENIGNLALKKLYRSSGDKIYPVMVPCTPEGCIELLDRYQIPIEGKEVVILGRSNIVGMPLSLLFLHRNATVTICHSHTENLKKVTSRADILVVACGRKEMITSEYVKENAVVIDVGIHSVEDETRKRGYRITGDVHFNFVKSKCSYLTPVPGGVGPMTIAMLLTHVVQLASIHS